MKVIPFEQDEYIVMAMFEAENRQATMQQIGRASCRERV